MTENLKMGGPVSSARSSTGAPGAVLGRVRGAPWLLLMAALVVAVAGSMLLDSDAGRLLLLGLVTLSALAVAGALLVRRLVDQRKRVEGDLAEAEERFSLAFEHAPIGMVLAGTDARIFEVNRAFAEMLGRSPATLIGTAIADITHPDDWENSSRLMQQLVRDEVSTYRLEKRYLHVDGHTIWVSINVSLVRDAAGRPLYMIGQVEDVTDRKTTGELLAHQAIHDPLTGLPNRILFVDRLRFALERAVQTQSRLAVLFLDLDRFKVVNDSLGHAAGDRLIVAIGDRLRSTLRPSDTVARFGGDVFTVLCEDLGDERHAQQVAERLSQVVSQPVALAEGEVFVTFSIGIALSGAVGETPETLLRDADSAMHRAKERGRSRTEVFDEKAHNLVVDHLWTGNALHRALDRGELEVHYQPVIDLESGRVSGFEALLRWRHPDRGVITPGDFIELAEETGVIVPVGMWVFEEACRQTVSWQVQAGGPLEISVNLSPRQLSEPSLPEEVARVLRETDIRPDSVWLEITESTLMQDAEATILALRALRALGVHLAIDDFGTGYSSLSYLKRFPVEALKVDQSFVDGLGREPEDTAIVTACVSLAHALGLSAIAEGVEKPTQLAELRTLGCELAQGYLWSPARSPADLGPRPAEGVPNLPGPQRPRSERAG